MADTGFTPGPWDAWQPSSEVGCWSICDCAESRSLAAVWPESLMGDKLAVEANAHLIAAAPALYEALIECLDQAEGCFVNHYDHGYEDPALPPHIAKARAALKQARGEA